MLQTSYQLIVIQVMYKGNVQDDRAKARRKNASLRRMKVRRRKARRRKARRRKAQRREARRRRRDEVEQLPDSSTAKVIVVNTLRTSAKRQNERIVCVTDSFSDVVELAQESEITKLR